MGTDERLRARVTAALAEWQRRNPDAVTRFVRDNPERDEGGGDAMSETIAPAHDNGTALATREAAAIMDRVLAVGDLKEITHEERVQYYLAVCQSLKLNPFTRPFGYVEFSEKVGERYEKRMVLYARKDCAEQLRRLHGVSITSLVPEQQGDIYTVTATAKSADGRTDMDQGVVSLGNLSGNLLANARMRAVTKAKRRVTLSLVGLGIVDESELETLQNARTVRVNEETGEILEESAPAALPPPPSAPTAENACSGCGKSLTKARVTFCAHNNKPPTCVECDEKGKAAA